MICFEVQETPNKEQEPTPNFQTSSGPSTKIISELGIIFNHNYKQHALYSFLQ